MNVLMAACLMTTNSRPLLVRAAFDRSTSASSRALMRSQQAVVNDLMMIRRSLCGAMQPIRCAYNSANTKSAKLSSSHVANWISLGIPMHLRPVS